MFMSMFILIFILMSMFMIIFMFPLRFMLIYTLLNNRQCAIAIP
jgi:hypothetical protein